MRRRTLWRSAGVLCTGWMLAGCAMLGQPEPVRVNVVGIEPLPGESMELRMAIKLRIQNPNDAALDFDGISIELDVRGSPFASGVSDKRESIPRFGEIVISVPVSVSALSAARQVIGLASSERPTIDYVLHGRLAGTPFGGLRFESKGAIDLPKELAPN